MFRKNVPEFLDIVWAVREDPGGSGKSKDIWDKTCELHGLDPRDRQARRKVQTKYERDLPNDENVCQTKASHQLWQVILGERDLRKKTRIRRQQRRQDSLQHTAYLIAKRLLEELLHGNISEKLLDLKGSVTLNDIIKLIQENDAIPTEPGHSKESPKIDGRDADANPFDAAERNLDRILAVRDSDDDD